MYKNFIEINFSYNGDLGRLQQKTIDNKMFIGRLLQSDIITREEWREGITEIKNYFENEIKKVLACPASYID